MIKTLSSWIGLIAVIIVIFLPLAYAIDEVNQFSDMNYGEYTVEVDQ